MEKSELISLLSSESVNVVDFWAPWCGPCRVIGPILESIELEDPRVNLIKVNVDESPELAREFGIRSIPTIMIMDGNGNALSTSVGAKDKTSLTSMINEAKLGQI